MKKLLSILLALALVLSLSAPVFAAPNQTEAQTNLSFVYEPAVPVYTVSIPASLTLAIGDNYMEIELVTEVDTLQGRNVNITFEGTNYSDHGSTGMVLVMQSDPNDYMGYVLFYQLRSELHSGSLFSADIGKSLLVFDEYDGIIGNTGIAVKPIIIYISPPPNAQIVPGRHFFGYINFGIKLV